jgi:hypothetical protein
MLSTSIADTAGTAIFSKTAISRFYARKICILGDSDFVEPVLQTANEAMERKYRLKAAGYDFDMLVGRVADLFQLKSAESLLPTKQRHRVKARSLPLKTTFFSKNRQNA